LQLIPAGTSGESVLESAGTSGESVLESARSIYETDFRFAVVDPVILRNRGVILDIAYLRGRVAAADITHGRMFLEADFLPAP
jgi:hypothetical protein